MLCNHNDVHNYNRYQSFNIIGVLSKISKYKWRK